MASFDTMIKNLDAFDGEVIPSEFNVNDIGGKSLLLDKDEATIKLIMAQNPNITRKQAEYMVYSEDKLNKKEDERDSKREPKEEETANAKDNRKGLTPAEKEQRRADRRAKRDKRKAKRKEKIKSYKKIFEEKIKALKKRAKEIKEEIKQALFKLWKELKELGKDLIDALVHTVTAIAGIAQCIAAPPWNVGLAISYAFAIVGIYLALLSKIKNVIPWLQYLKKCPLVTDKKNLKIIGTIFNAVIVALRALWKPIKFIGGLADKLIRWISSFLKRKKRSIFRQATKELKDLGHLYKYYFIHPKMKGEKDLGIISIPFPFLPGYLRGDYYGPDGNDVTYPCYAWEQEDIDSVQGLLDRFIVGFEGNKTKNRVVAYRIKPTPEAKELGLLLGKGKNIDNVDYGNFDLDKIADELQNISMPAIVTEDNNDENLDGSEDRYIYNIELPDGTIIPNITEEGINFYRETYVLKYINAVTQSVSFALQESQTNQ
jgi:hypothetical protein